MGRRNGEGRRQEDREAAEMRRQHIHLVDRVTGILGEVQLQLEEIAEQLERCEPGQGLIDVAVQLRRLSGKVDELARLLGQPGDEG